MDVRLSSSCWHVPESSVLRQKFIFSRDMTELMPMSADVSESSGNSLPFTCNALEQEKKVNAGSKPQLAIIVLVHLKCGSNIKSLSVRT
jgi:hypothetical protein